MHAVMDIGTNSVRLLVADYAENRLLPLQQELRITRLGEGVDRNGRLAEPAIERTLRALEEYHQIVSSLEVSTIQLVATSAVRDSANRAELAERIRRRLGWELRVLSGDEEAQLSFAGAVFGAAPSLQQGEKLAVLDIGGGSSEVVFGASDGSVISLHSLQLGSVRMTEKWISGHPVSDQDMEKLRTGVCLQLERELLSGEAGHPSVLLAVGGTATTMAAVALELEVYDAQAVTGTRYSRVAVAAMCERLRKMTIEERRGVVGLVPGREDVIVAGLSILLGLIDHYRQDSVMVVDSDLLQGLILTAAVVD